MRKCRRAIERFEPLFRAAYGGGWRKCLMADYGIAFWSASRWGNGMIRPPAAAIRKAQDVVVKRLAYYDRDAATRRKRELAELNAALALGQQP